MARPRFPPGSLGHSYLPDFEGLDEDNRMTFMNRIPDNLPSLMYQATADDTFAKDPEKKQELTDATFHLLRSLVNPTVAAQQLLPDGAYVIVSGERDEHMTDESSIDTLKPSAIRNLVKTLTACSNAFSKALDNDPQLIESLAKAADIVAKKAFAGSRRRSDRMLSSSLSPSASYSAEAEEESELFFPDRQQHRSTHSLDGTPSTIDDRSTTSLKRKASALSLGSSNLRTTQERGRRSNSVIASVSSNFSPPGTPPRPEESPGGAREPSPTDVTTEVAYVDIYKYGTGCIINITDIIVDALDFASNGLLPLAISGSFIKGMELWAKIGLRPQDQEDRAVTEIRRRDQPWKAGTMIARFTYDPTTLDLSRDACFDVHFSDKGKGSYFRMRRSTGIWQGRFPSDVILAENFGVTHYVKVWDPYLPIDKFTKPSRLPTGRSMRCRKYKCGGDNVKFVEREYFSPLDLGYISRFLPARPDGDGGAGYPHYGGRDGGDDDDDDSDDGGGDARNGRRDGDGRDDIDADNDEKKRVRIEKLTARCNTNLEARDALPEKGNNKEKATEKRKCNRKGHESES